MRVGLAGPAGILTLTRYALHCGIGNSLHVLTENPSFAKLLIEKGPEPIIRGIARRYRRLVQIQEIQRFHWASQGCIFTSSAGSIKPSTGYTLTNEGSRLVNALPLTLAPCASLSHRFPAQPWSKAPG